MGERGAMALDLDWITPHLAVGGRYPVEAVPHLARALRVRHVVDVRVESCDDEAVLRAHGISLLHLPTMDMRAISQPMLDGGVAWVGARLDLGSRVYVHCEHGAGRSALLALCVLVSRGDPPLGALERAKGARWQVSPSPEQLQAFRTFCARRAELSRPGWAVPPLEELMRIAYRHLQRDASGG